MCQNGMKCPTNGCMGKLSWVRDEIRGGYAYPVYSCPRCGYVCRDERAKG
jgi:rubrerythrin